MRKGLKTLICGIVFLLIGVLVIPAIMAFTLFLADDGEQQFVVPGKAEILIEQPGQYYLWNNFQTIHDGRTYNQSSALPGGLFITVTDANGKALEFTPSTRISINLGNSAKNSIGFVDVTTPGTVTVSVGGDIDARVFSFSALNLGYLINTLIAALVCIFIGVLMLIFGIIKLCKNRKKRE